MKNKLDLEQLLTTNNLKTKLIRDSFEGLIIRLLYILLTFTMGVVLVRVLGVKNWGVFSYFSSIIAILTIPSEFGIPILVLRETSKNIATQNWGKVKGLWNWSVKMIFLLSISLILITIITYLLTEKGGLEEHRTSFFLGLILVFFFSFIHLRGVQLVGMKKVALGQLPEQIIVPGVFIILLLISTHFLEMQLSPQQALILKIISAITAIIIGTVLVNHFSPKELKNASPESDGRSWSLNAIQLAGINGVYRLNSESSLIILGLFVNSSEIGLYKAAVNFSIFASIALQVINLVVAPQFASMYAKKEIERLQKLVTVSARVILIMNLFITIILAIWGKAILSLAYKPEFVDSYPVLLILLIGQCVNSATGSVGYLLNMTHKEKFVIKGVSIATLLNIVLNFALSPRYGMIGAAIGTTVSMVVSNIYFWFAVRKHLGINSFFIPLKYQDKTLES